jgi:hypothetical protein
MLDEKMDELGDTEIQLYRKEKMPGPNWPFLDACSAFSSTAESALGWSYTSFKLALYQSV